MLSCAHVLRALTILSITTLSACAVANIRGGGYCAPPQAAAFAFPVDEPLARDAPATAQLAAMLGLSGITAEQIAQSPALRARVLERLQLAVSAINATTAELQCESERAAQSADFLRRGQTRTVQALTVSSIIAAAITGIVSAVLTTNNRPAAEQDSVAIGGGVATAALGLSSLFVDARMRYEHSRNLLADIWLGNTTGEFHPIVWAYLTRAQFSNTHETAIRERIVARWNQFREIADPATSTLLFGSGGSYDADTLRLRAAMLDEVKAEVALAHQDLAAFAAAMLR